ncbi:poly-gamma-glutamate synthesis protein (capsule biosynthesis protein) [Paenibacillus cellulosilyticus]|uniref:Poly-gamma-glutamate synthesis protein (Capsule biosynthesis protein) n=1 Tax=Paenibacillus cellulosilyticus TaxID=375489 RepID=A0A2V2YRR9_9BACL|nr:CapA family protein [Paenibacillus cellulosilyticus]PWV99688.1 poly-gamma-glutamate synthesis protein (capsule biosynthesis protein) [Paenibacillus cellulosilyticus]QKS44876.1 CapA family protein [Paenibacillus cellulosilyticus]
MYVSRSDTHQQNKKRRSRRFRKLAAINLAMLAVILILGAVFWSTIFPNKQSGSNTETAQHNDSSANEEQKDEATHTDDASTPNAATDEQTSSDEDAAEQSASTTDTDTDTDTDTVTDGSGTEANEGNATTDSSVEGAGSTGAIGSSTGSTGSIRLAFVGDLLLGSSVETTMRKQGLDYPFSGALDYLLSPDITAGNLENPITTRGIPAANKQYVFKGSPDLLPPLKEAGFDIVSLANNHTLDQGTEGLLDTIAALKDAGIANVGGGNDDTEAFAPVVLEANGIKVAYLSVSRVVPEGSWKADKNHPGVAEAYDSTRAVAAIAKAKQEADLVVMMVHWGVERADQPVEHQTTLARQFIDAGADLVIGSHPHVMQGFEQYKGKWIAYSLGNFIFNVTTTPRTKETGVLDAVCTKDGECNLTFHPMVSDQSRPAPVEPEKAKELTDYLTSISKAFGVKVDEAGIITAQ